MDFCDTLAAILKTAKAEQHKNCFRYGELYSLNYYSEVKEKDRTYYEVAKRRYAFWCNRINRGNRNGFT